MRGLFVKFVRIINRLLADSVVFFGIWLVYLLCGFVIVRSSLLGDGIGNFFIIVVFVFERGLGLFTVILY